MKILEDFEEKGVTGCNVHSVNVFLLVTQKLSGEDKHTDDGRDAVSEAVHVETPGCQAPRTHGDKTSEAASGSSSSDTHTLLQVPVFLNLPPELGTP